VHGRRDEAVLIDAGAADSGVRPGLADLATRPRRLRWIVRVLAVLAVVAVALVVAGSIVLSMPQFGAGMAGARLERAQVNPQYRDGRFVNVVP
jgi:hypothetical protein